MKPLHILSAGGSISADQIITKLTNIATYAFADLDFTYRDTIVSYEQIPNRIQGGPPVMVCKVCIVFEAGSAAEIDKFNLKVNEDPNLKELRAPSPFGQMATA
jgi:hypothetical protein